MTIDTNELRRLAQAATPGPWKMLPVGDGRQKFAVADSEFLSILTVTDEGGATFGTVYDDDDARFIAAANPATVIEILDRLEAAEKAIAEAYQRGYKTGQEEIEKERDALRGDKAILQQMTYSLKDHFESAKTAWKEADKTCRDLTEKVIPNLRESLEAAEKERNALQAMIEQMEKQEPVYLFRRKGLDDFCTCSKERYESFSAKPRLFEVKTLYALPGAQPTPIVPDGWQLVPIEPTLEMLRALIDGANQYDSWNEGYRDMLEAAPEAKP